MRRSYTNSFPIHAGCCQQPKPCFQVRIGPILQFRLNRRQPGHYTRFGVTSGWPVTRAQGGSVELVRNSMSAFGGCTYRGIPLHSFRIADDSPTIPLPDARSVILKFVKGQRNDLLFSEPMTCLWIPRSSASSRVRR